MRGGMNETRREARWDQCDETDESNKMYKASQHNIWIMAKLDREAPEMKVASRPWVCKTMRLGNKTKRRELVACRREQQTLSQSCAAVSAKFHCCCVSLCSPQSPSFLMPCCPQCSKKCKTETWLLQHMNHLSSKCIHFFDKLIWISEVLHQNWSTACWWVVSHRVESEGSEDVEMGDPHPSMSSKDNNQSSTSIAGDVPLNLPEQTLPCSQLKNYHTEVYPGAAQTYGRGPTFMDELGISTGVGADLVFAVLISQHGHNWSIFVAGSGKLIDTAIVWFWYLTLTSRLRAWSSHFSPQKTFEEEQRCFHQGLHGTVHRGRPYIPLNTQ